MTAPTHGSYGGRIRSEWIEPKRVLEGAVEEPASLQDFAGSETADLLAVEPRLRVLGKLVIMSAQAGDIGKDVWRGIESLAAVFVGPGRSVAQMTPVCATSVAVASTLAGETTRRRYVEALRARAAEEAGR